MNDIKDYCLNCRDRTVYKNGLCSICGFSSEESLNRRVLVFRIKNLR